MVSVGHRLSRAWLDSLLRISLGSNQGASWGWGFYLGPLPRSLVVGRIHVFEAIGQKYHFSGIESCQPRTAVSPRGYLRLLALGIL